MNQVEVMNAALALLAQEPVADLTPASIQQSNAALKLLRQMTGALKFVLGRHGWLCALDYLTLTPANLAGYTNWKYPYVYVLAPTYLRVWEIEGCPFDQLCGWGRHGQRWETGTVEIDTGARQIIRSRDGISLNVSAVRTAAWEALSPLVADAVAHELAARGAFSVTANSQLEQSRRALAEARFQIAASGDGTQADVDTPIPSEMAWLRFVGA